MPEELFLTLTPSVLAVVTTVHLSILLLRIHRNPRGRRHDLLVAPSLFITATPWMFPSSVGVAVGIVMHLAWFMACERLVVAEPAAAAAPSAAAPPPAPRPATPPPPKPAAPPGFVQVPVFAVFRETDDITTFRMARPAGFEFSPGQFVTVRVTVDGTPVVRCYSISSAPQSAGYLEISVKRQGLMSGTLHATVRPGSMVWIRKPAGAFVYPDGDDRPIVLLGGGIGITPMMSMLRHAVHAHPTRPVTLLYSVHTHSDVVFREELAWLARRHPNAKVVVTMTRGPHGTEYLSGRIDRRMLTEQVENILDSVYMICGPGPMISALTETLIEMGVAADQVRSEAFEAAIATANQPAEAPASEPVEQPAAANGFQLRLVQSGHTVAACGSRTLLETCEAAGVELPSACRAGVCGTCRTRLVDGDVRCEADALDDSDRADGYILPCVAWPEGNCALEA